MMNMNTNTIEFRIVAVSSNTGSFGHNAHIMVDRHGQVYEVPRIRSSYPGQWNKGDIIRVPADLNRTPQFHLVGAECARKVNDLSEKSAVDYVWADDFMQKEAEKAAAAKDKRHKFLSNNHPTKEDKAAIDSLSKDGQKHGQEKGRPAYYRLPLNRRDRIVDFLKGENGWSHVGGCNYNHKSWYFGFDVKLHGLDLSFDHLLDVYRKSGEMGKDSPLAEGVDPAYVDACRTRYNEVYSDGDDTSSLWDMAVEDARRHVVEGDDGEASDSYGYTWSGHKVDARDRKSVV